MGQDFGGPDQPGSYTTDQTKGTPPNKPADPVKGGAPDKSTKNTPPEGGK